MTEELELKKKQIEISIHTLRVEGDEELDARRDEVRQISIHTLRVEGDNDFVMAVLLQSIFQSTPSAWRVTCPSPSSMAE